MFSLTLPDDIRSNKTNLPVSIQKELIKQPNLLDDVLAQSSMILFFTNHPTYNLPWFIPLVSLTMPIKYDTFELNPYPFKKFTKIRPYQDIEIKTVPLSDSKNAELIKIIQSWFDAVRNAITPGFASANYKDNAYLLMAVNKTLIELELTGVFPTSFDFTFGGYNGEIDMKLSYDYMAKDVPDYSQTLLAETLKLPPPNQILIEG